MGVNTSSINPLCGAATVEDTVGIRNKNEGTSTLKPFNCYVGRVVEANYATRMLNVKIDRVTISNCIYAAGAAAAVIGASNYQLPSPGSQVVCLYTPLCTFVIGSIPQSVKHEQIPHTTATGNTEYHASKDFPVSNARIEDNMQDYAAPGHNTSNDVTPIEEEFGNDIGLVIRMLANFIQVDAGGLSLIEQCLANDMVRILDNYFVHHNCGGDDMIWCGERCNYESHFTSYPHEAAGKATPEEVFATPVKGDGIYTDVLTEEGMDDIINKTGRWRKSTYFGFLGDMLHFWITNPTKVLENTMAAATRAGQVSTYVGGDGTVVVQGAGDILIQATSYMVIPDVNMKWDHPKLDWEQIVRDLDTNYLKIWGQGKRWEDLNASVWQMRNYLKYLTVWRRLQRFRQVKEATGGEYCTFTSEVQSPVGDMDGEEQDRKDAGNAGAGAGGTASMRCSPDGSVVFISSCKEGISSVIMNQGNVQVSAANNIELKAPGTVSITGKQVSIKAHHAVEIVSLCGHIVQKARTAWKALCEAGRVWLKSDMPSGEEGKQVSDDCMEQEFDEYSVVIDAAEGKTLIHGNKLVSVGTTDSEEGDINIEALNGNASVHLHGHDIDALARNSIHNKARESWGVWAKQSLVESYAHRIGKHVSITPASMDVDYKTRMAQLYTQQTFAKDRFIGPDEHVVEYDTKNPPDETDPEVEHEKTDKLGEELEALTKKDVTDEFPEDEFKGIHCLWKLPDWSAPREFLDPDSLKRDPYTDEVILGNVPFEEGEEPIIMKWGSNVHLMQGKRTHSLSYPWPGVEASVNVFKDDKMSMLKPLEEDFDKDDIKELKDMTPEQLSYIFKKNSYEQDSKQ